MIPISQMRKLRFKEMKWLARGHTSYNEWNLEGDDGLTPKACVIFHDSKLHSIPSKCTTSHAAIEEIHHSEK